PVKAGAVALVFLVVDFGFFTANVTKVLEGGYVPLLLAVAVYGIMWIWHRGTSAVRARVLADQVPLQKFVETLGSCDVAGVPGTAVFLTRADSETPPVFGLARSEKPFPAPVRPHTQAHRHIVSAHKTERTDSGCARCRQILARRSALWIYGAAKRLSHTRRLQDQGCGNQSRRCHFLHRSRDDHTARGSQRDPALAGSHLCSDDSQLCSDHRRPKIAPRPSSGNRSRGCDLTLRLRSGESP